MDEFESRIRASLNSIDAVKTPLCLDVTTIGLYAEEKLFYEEKLKAEDHVKSCLYCLNQLAEMKELLYFQNLQTPVSADLVDKLTGLCPEPHTPKSPKSFVRSFFNKIRGLLAFPMTQWRYSVVSLVSVCVTVLAIFALSRHEKTAEMQPNVNLNSFVNVRALGNNGQVLREAQGVLINSKGLVASNLSPLAGASTVQVTLRDGTSYNTQHIWKDDDRNLAVMKIENESSPFMRMADIEHISIGERAFLLVDPSKPKKGFKEGIVSDFKVYPGRHKGDELQYIQLATLSSTLTRGALVDKDGRLIGLLLTEEKNINLAVPLQNVEKMVKEHKAIPLSELKDVKYSAEALNLYMQGILARDTQRWDLAIDFFKRATQLNPNLGGAHLELGYLYYRKRLYDLEGQEYQQALRINPENTDAIYAYATNLETRGLYKQAIEEYEKVISIDPTDAETYYNLGVAYIADGQKSKAMGIYAKLKPLDPGSAEMLKRLAR